MTGTRHSPVRHLAVVMLLLPAVVPAGCMPRSGSAEDYARYEFIRDDLPPEVAQLLMQEYTTTACAYFDQGVQEVAERQTDVDVAENVERFREAGLLAIRRAGWRLQPIGAAFDSVILVEQLEGFLESDSAREAFGPARPELVQVVGTIRPLVDQVVEQITVGSDATPPERASDWVRENPLEDLDLTRVSPLLGVADQADRIDDPMRAIARVQFSAGAAYARLHEALLSLPADVRLQIERVVRGIMREPLLVNALVGFARLGDGMRETGEALMSIDAHLDDHREAVLADIDRQRIATIDAIAAERSAVQETIAAERIAVLEALSEERSIIVETIGIERATVLDAISAERAVVLEAITSERIAVMAALDGQVDSALDRTESIVATSVAQAIEGVGDTIRHLLLLTGAWLTVVVITVTLLVTRRRSAA